MFLRSIYQGKLLKQDKYLSFVTEGDIAQCFIYGDMITKLNFDLENEEFMKSVDTPYNYTGNLLGKYESKYLLVDNNYSLEDINNIVMLFDYVKTTQQLGAIFAFPCGTLDERLNRFHFCESENLVKYLKKEFLNNIYMSPDDIRNLIKIYMGKK